MNVIPISLKDYVLSGGGANGESYDHKYKEKTIYHSLDKYLDFLRLMRALRLLKDHPEYSIEAIAMDAGFNTVRTLNRKIQEALGITPRQFRDITNPE